MYARVIVDVHPAHLDRPFDYAIADGQHVEVGTRVRVTFAGRKRVGWVVQTSTQPSTDTERIRPLDAVDGTLTWFDDSDLEWFRWVADRWAGTLADVLRHALPHRIAAVERDAVGWGSPMARDAGTRPPCADTGWRPYAASALLRSVFAGGAAPAFWLRVLPGDDAAALISDLVARCIAGGRDALVLVPDPGSDVADAALTVVAADERADFRSQRPRDDATAFWRCRLGHARVAVGERSAAFAPVRALGLVVVHDEANRAYKERRSPRHNARDVALARARREGATCVVVGDLPSAALWRLLDDGHVDPVAADTATERGRAPRVDVVDLDDPRPGTRRTRFADRASAAMSDAVKGSGAAVVLAARGGEGAGLACKRCRLRRPCPVCAGSVRTAVDDRWECAACGWNGMPFPCPDCGATEHAPLAAGAGRFAAELSRTYPDADVVRMEGFDAEGPRRRPAVAVMTRGSVVARPAWLAGGSAEVTVLPDADAMLGRPALDAAEDALRLWFAVGHWSRRLVVQTREPRSHAVQALVRWDPEGFWKREAERRAELEFPPATTLVAVSAGDAAAEVGDDLRAALSAPTQVLGPDPDGAFLIKTPDRRETVTAVARLRRSWSVDGRRVRVEVDPIA